MTQKLETPSLPRNRDKPVFISYSSEDEAIASQVVDHLESRGLGCWWAPRAIPAGASFPEEIVEGIQAAQVILFLVSPASNESVHTRKELTLAVSRGTALLPVRLNAFQPWGHVRYFLADCQWIDVANTGIESGLDVISDCLRQIMKTGKGRQAAGLADNRDWPGTVPAATLGIKSHAPYLPLHMDRSTPCTALDQPSLLLQAYREFIPLRHREEEMEQLRNFAEGPGKFRWRLFTGEGGIGKTRLAREFLKTVMAQGWQAGMLSSDRLEAFVREPGFPNWEPTVSTFIVVDYAASKKDQLCRLLQHFGSLEQLAIHDTSAEGPKVRLLILERHGDENAGWLYELLSCGESEVRELIANQCYQGLTEILPPHVNTPAGDQNTQPIDATKSIISETFSSWADLHGKDRPALPEFSESEWRRIRLNTGNRPLYLQMAALHACQVGSAKELPLWGRGFLLEAAIQRELQYIERACGGQSSLRLAVGHLAGILCIAGIGLSRSGKRWRQIVESEINEIGVAAKPHDVELRRKQIFQVPADGDSETETGLIQPDILAEGFAATMLKRGQAEFDALPHETLARIIGWSEMRGWANLLRAVQDLHGLEAYAGIEKWPLAVLEDCSTGLLKNLSAKIPDRTTSLHELGIRTNELLVARAEENTEKDLAQFLLKLGTHRHRGRVRSQPELEQAREELERAINLLGPLVKTSNDGRLRLQLASAHREAGWTTEDIDSSDKDMQTADMRHTMLGGFAAVNAYPENPESLPTTEDTLHRLLAHPDPEDPELAREFANCLNNLSRDFQEYLGARIIACDIIARAVAVGEKLAAGNWRRYAPDLARYLNNQSMRLEAVGEVRQALAVADQSTRIREEFMGDNPDQYAEPLAKSLRQLLNLHLRLNDYNEARRIGERRLVVFRELVARDPVGFRAEYCRALHSMAQLAHLAGRVGETHEILAEELAILEELLQEDFAQNFDRLVEVVEWGQRICMEENDSITAELYDKRLGHLAIQIAAQKPGAGTQGLLERAKSLTKQFLAAQKTELAQVWKDAVIALVKSLPEGSPLFRAHQEAITSDFLWGSGWREDAVAISERYTPRLKQAFENRQIGDDTEHLLRLGCNLSHGLLLHGDWRCDRAKLKEAESVAEETLTATKDQEKNHGYFVGVLFHNLGHALYRRGEIEADPQLVAEGLASFQRSFELHDQLGLHQACEQTAQLRDLATTILERLKG